MKIKNFIRKVIMVIVFIVIAYNICEAAPYYIRDKKFDGTTRLIIDDVEKTEELPDDIFIFEGEILFSLDTAQKFIDSRIKFENDCIKANYDKYILRMPSGENIATINKNEIMLDATIEEISGDIYFPIKPLEEIYDIDIEFNDKVIITTNAAESFSKAELAKNVKLKKYKREKGLTICVMKKGETIEIATPNFEDVKPDEYVYIRNSKGDLGYVKKSKLKLVKIENEVIIDGINESRRLPDDAKIKDNKILLSIDTIQKYIDEYIYFDKKYNTVVACGNGNIVKMILGSNEILKNDTSVEIKVPTQLINSKVYIPIEELTDVYNIEIKKDDKIRINVGEQKITNNRRNEKISLVWEYAGNSTPDRNGESKINAINIVSPTWIYVKNSSGEIRQNISSDYIKWATQNGYEVWPTIKNDDIGIEKTSLLVTDMKNRKMFIDNIVKICETYKFKGINLDFEHMYQRDRDEYVMLVRELSSELTRRNIITSVDVNVPDGSSEWSLCYKSKAISDSCDYIMVMAYDQYGQSSKKSGPVASLDWVDTNLDKLINRDKIDNNKLVLGVPFYSRYWATKNGEVVSTKAYSMSNVKDSKNKYKNSTIWDEVLGQYVITYDDRDKQIEIYVEDENSLKEKLKLVEKYNLAGIAAWRRGQEINAVWKVIEEGLK